MIVLPIWCHKVRHLSKVIPNQVFKGTTPFYVNVLTLNPWHFSSSLFRQHHALALIGFITPLYSLHHLTMWFTWFRTTSASFWQSQPCVYFAILSINASCCPGSAEFIWASLTVYMLNKVAKKGDPWGRSRWMMVGSDGHVLHLKAKVLLNSVPTVKLILSKEW